jgi:hypothetical protein
VAAGVYWLSNIEFAQVAGIEAVWDERVCGIKMMPSRYVPLLRSPLLRRVRYAKLRKGMVFTKLNSFPFRESNRIAFG